MNPSSNGSLGGPRNALIKRLTCDKQTKTKGSTNKVTGKLIKMGMAEVNEGSDDKSIAVDVSSAIVLESLPQLQPSIDDIDGGRGKMTDEQQRSGLSSPSTAELVVGKYDEESFSLDQAEVSDMGSGMSGGDGKTET